MIKRGVIYRILFREFSIKWFECCWKMNCKKYLKVRYLGLQIFLDLNSGIVTTIRSDILERS